MSMTAAELRAIVCDVPREALGNDVAWTTDPENAVFFVRGVAGFLPVTVAELAFIGSMTAWLQLGLVVGKCEGHDCPDGTDATHIVYDVTDTECVREWVASSLVAALAAACKEEA